MTSVPPLAIARRLAVGARGSGKSLTVMTRRVKNQRLAAGYVWAYYDRRRATGDGHAAAQRHLFNRVIGMLHHRLANRLSSTRPAPSPRPRPPLLDNLITWDVSTMS
jgi:hypothetical protein